MNGCGWARSLVLILGLMVAGGGRCAVQPQAFGTWWWRGRELSEWERCRDRLDLLSAQGVNEIYCAIDFAATPRAHIARFVRAAAAQGMRVACLAGDVSWIMPGQLGFDELYGAFRAYQRAVPAEERFFALHLDVEPHQDHVLGDARRWQLYADFVLRATAMVHRDGFLVEWDIPFWLDGKFVTVGVRERVSLLEAVMDHSDGVVLMSYRDTAAAILETGREELALAKTRPCRVLFGAETGKTDEGDFVSFFEEGKAALKAELQKVRAVLAQTPLRAGSGIAVHHVGSWQALRE